MINCIITFTLAILMQQKETISVDTQLIFSVVYLGFPSSDFQDFHFALSRFDMLEFQSRLLQRKTRLPAGEPNLQQTQGIKEGFLKERGLLIEPLRYVKSPWFESLLCFDIYNLDFSRFVYEGYLQKCKELKKRNLPKFLGSFQST